MRPDAKSTTKYKDWELWEASGEPLGGSAEPLGNLWQLPGNRLPKRSTLDLNKKCSERVFFMKQMMKNNRLSKTWKSSPRHKRNPPPTKNTRKKEHFMRPDAKRRENRSTLCAQSQKREKKGGLYATRRKKTRK